MIKLNDKQLNFDELKHLLESPTIYELVSFSAPKQSTVLKNAPFPQHFLESDERYKEKLKNPELYDEFGDMR